MWSGGVFSRFEGATGCADKEAAGTGITAVLEDQRFNEFATGINTCLTKDGQNTATANLPMGGFKHTSVAVASAATDYARADQVQNSSFLWLGTTGGTADAQTASATPTISAYVAGQSFKFIAGATNTSATPTININSIGAKTLKRPDGNPCVAGDITSGNTYEIIYNGTNFILVNISPVWNTYTPTMGTVTGSLSGTSTNGNYITHLGKTVSIALNVTTTLSGGPSSVITFTLPTTAANVALGTFYGKGNAGLPFNGLFGYLNSTTVAYVGLTDAVLQYQNGTVDLFISGTYKSA